MDQQKGFTLIELLVVIAIIGILSAVVLASLSAARTRAADASVKSNLATVRAQASMYYDLQGRYASATGSYYSGNCLTSQTMFRETTLTGEARTVADSITTAIAEAYANSNGSKECRMDGPRIQYMILMGLKSSDTYWCIDASGKAKNIGTSTPAVGVLECP